MSNNNNKSLDVLIIGMGFSGICAAIKLIKSNITNIQIHEKSEGIGGTWHENIYPGAACDVPSHLYCYSFEPNPNWSRRYAKQAEIKKYLENCVNKYDILKYAKFSSKVVSMVYQEKPQTWDVTFDNGNVISANHVIHAGGGIHKPKIPNFKDLSKFQGKIMHTAKWDKHTEFINKNIGIIGSAASAIQVIPEIAKVAKQLKVFQRTPNYIIPRGDRAYKSSEKQRFRKFPWLLKLLRWFLYMRLEFITFPVIRKNSYLGKRAAKSIIKYMKSSIRNSSLKEFFVPDYSLGCKRILLSDNLFHAINRDNVEVITNEILSFNESGITTNDLNKYNFDVPVWINHGINLNYQKIGDYPNMHGDDPNHSCYHSDLLSESGFEYVWTGKATHIIGQEGKNNLSIFTKSFIQKLLKKIKYRNVQDPIYDDDNKLLRPLFLRDGNFYTFMGITSS